MSRKYIILLVAIALLLFGGMWWFSKNQAKHYRWNENYAYRSKHPFGVLILHGLLKNYFPGNSLTVIRKPLDKALPKDKTGANYFFIGSELALDSAQTQALFDFVKRGNRAFVASGSMPEILLDSLFREHCLDLEPLYEEEIEASDTAYYSEGTPVEEEEGEEYDSTYEDSAAEEEYVEEDSLYEEPLAPDTSDVYKDGLPIHLADSIFQEFLNTEELAFKRDSSVNLRLLHPQLANEPGYPMEFFIRQSRQSYSWNYLPYPLFCDSQAVFARLGTLEDSLVNFVKVPFGEGEFLLHTTPLAFTNYFLTKTSGAEYAAKSLSHLSPGDIYWDTRRLAFPDFNLNRQWQKGPLQFILAQPPLAWAWYLLLGLALLYLIFRAKRRQRIIPVTERNENTSLDFIQTIGRLYFVQSDHRQLALQKTRLWLGFVRERYRLPTKELNEQWAKMLAAKAGVPENLVQNILKLDWVIANSGEVSAERLEEFHRALEQFYRQCS